jgi:hypothetical protein
MKIVKYLNDIIFIKNTIPVFMAQFNLMVDYEVTHDQCSDRKDLCFQCSCVQSVQILDKQDLTKCVVFEEIENLKSDIDEFNNVLGIAKQLAVREAILAEINFLTAKIESIKDLA